MDRAERTTLLRSSPYFAEVDEAVLERIALDSVVRSLTAGQSIFSEGEAAGRAALHFVASGVVRIFKVSLDGREQILRLMNPGDSFADVAAFDGGPYPANADAFEHATLLIVPRDTLVAALVENPRMALGALPRHVMANVLERGAALVLAGLAVGLAVAVAGALALSRFISGLLFGVEPTDAWTLVAVSGVLAAVALAACYLPARRATRIDPARALRAE